jgi:multisubunit Na+/H+ antiporter MnhC subunit
MKHQSSTVSAILLALLGSGVILGLTAVAAFLTLFFSAFSNLGSAACQTCGPVSTATITAAIIGGIGIFVAALTFWGIFQTMRSQQKQQKK